jgi:phosphoserine phosphatase RsbU/P
MPSSSQTQVRFPERAELLDFLLEVSTLTAETLDVDRLLANVAEIVKDVIPYELFAILLCNERTRTLRMRYSICSCAANWSASSTLQSILCNECATFRS